MKPKNNRYAYEDTLLQAYTKIKKLFVTDLSTKKSTDKYIKEQSAKLNDLIKDNKVSTSREFHLDDAGMKRRLIAESKFRERGLKLAGKYWKETDDNISSVYENWLRCFLLMMPMPFAKSDSQNIALQVAIWILDEIKKENKIDELKEIIDEAYPDIRKKRKGAFLPIEDCHLIDSRHPSVLIYAVAEIVYFRNSDSKQISESDINNNNLLNKAILTNNHVTDGPNRKLFEDVIALIPDKNLNNAVKRTENLIWQIMDCIMKYYVAYEKRIHDIGKRTLKDISFAENEIQVRKKAIEKMKSGNSKFLDNKAPIPPAFNNLMLNNGIAEANIQSTFNSVVKTTDKLLDMMAADSNIEKDYEKIMNCTEDFLHLKSNQLFLPFQMGLINDCGYKSMFQKKSDEDDEKKITRIKDIFDAMEDCTEFERFPVKRPSEIIFTILYMLDRNMDTAYILPASELLFRMAYRKQEWMERTISNPKGRKSPKTKSVPKVFKDCTEHKTFAYIPDNREQLTIGQIFYHMSGVIAPRNISAYVSNYRKLLDYDMPEEYRTTIAFAATISGQAKNAIFQDATLEDYGFGPYEDEESNPDKSDKNTSDESEQLSVEELRKKYLATAANIKRKNKELIKAIGEEKEKNKKNEEELEDLKRKIKELSDENESIQLSLDLANDSEEDDDDADEPIDFPYELKHKYVIFGGYDKMGGLLDELLKGDVAYDTLKSGHYSKDAIKYADVVCILVKHIGHTPYYGIKNDARKCGKRILYLMHKNNEKNAKAVAKLDKLLCAQENNKEVSNS